MTKCQVEDIGLVGRNHLSETQFSKQNNLLSSNNNKVQSSLTSVQNKIVLSLQFSKTREGAGRYPGWYPGDRCGDRTTSGYVLITIERILTGQPGQG